MGKEEAAQKSVKAYYKTFMRGGAAESVRIPYAARVFDEQEMSNRFMALTSPLLDKMVEVVKEGVRYCE
jgi:hypothetical protein